MRTYFSAFLMGQALHFGFIGGNSKCPFLWTWRKFPENFYRYLENCAKFCTFICYKNLIHWKNSYFRVQVKVSVYSWQWLWCRMFWMTLFLLRSGKQSSFETVELQEGIEKLPRNFPRPSNKTFLISCLKLKGEGHSRN